MASKVLVNPSELSCSICLDVFKDPRVLPCVHSFCHICLEGWVKKSGSSQTITCPLCKDLSPVPSEGLKGIKSNYFIADLVERIHKTDLKSSSGGVGITKESIKLKEAIPIIYCKFHARNVIDQYCVDCDLPACGTCLLRDHRHHNLVDLDTQAEISKHKLQGVLRRTDVLIKLIDDKIQDSEKHEKQSTNDMNSIKRQINKVIDDRISKLNNQKQKLFSTLDRIQAQKEKVMTTVHDGQEFSKAAVTSLRSYSDNMLRHGRDFDRVEQAGDIQSRLASMKESRIPSFIWRRQDNKDLSSHCDMAVAEVSMTTDVVDSGSGAGAHRDQIVTKIRLVTGIPVGLVVMNQTMWSVHYHESSIRAYTLTPPHQKQKLSIPSLENSRSMVRFPSEHSQLVISDSDNKQLLWIQLEQRNGVWKVTSQRSVKVTYLPFGLGVCDNQLLVCDDNVIHVLSTSGEETHRVNMPQGVKPRRAVAQLTSPGFVIKDRINKQVVLMTEKGEIQHTYRGQKGFKPYDIVCHGHSIYVIDYNNHRVDELSVDGRHVRQKIINEDVACPRSMCVDDAGRRYVSHVRLLGKDQVWVIETQATPGDRILTQQTNMNLSVTWCN